MPSDVPSPNATGFRSLVEQIQEKAPEPVAERGPRRRSPLRRAAAPEATPASPRPKASAPVRLLSRRWL